MKIWEVNSSKRFSFGCIYLWTNLINGKHYVGQTVNFYQRIQRYKKGLINSYMKEDIDKYGMENFKVEILEKIEDISNEDFLTEREQYWMDYYQSYDLEKGYNIFDVAGNVCYLKRSDTIKERFCGEGNGMYGKHHSDEWKQNHSDCVKGLWEKEEYRKVQTERMQGENNPMYGVSLDGEKNGMYGKHHSDETKRKIAESKIGKTHAPTHFKRVRCVETGKIYNSQSEAAQEYGITPAAISLVCKGKNKTAKKMHWEFVD